MVYEIVRMIPKGRVTTYSEVAKRLGNPRGARAVGWAMRICEDPGVPCHRVVTAEGLVAGHKEDVKKRILQLRIEGVKMDGQRLDLEKYFFSDFD